MKKVTTSQDILSTIDNSKKAIASIKGLSRYTEKNQKILLTAFPDIKHIKTYIEVEKGLAKNKKFSCHSSSDKYFITCRIGLGISTDGETFQLTNHTLYTFIKELGIDMDSFKPVERKK